MTIEVHFFASIFDICFRNKTSKYFLFVIHFQYLRYIFAKILFSPSIVHCKFSYRELNRDFISIQSASLESHITIRWIDWTLDKRSKITNSLSVGNSFISTLVKTVCPENHDTFYMVSYYIKWGKASWTGSKQFC